MHLRHLVGSAALFAAAAFAQNPVTADSPFQVRYASNLNVGDSYVNITNTGGITQIVTDGTEVAAAPIGFAPINGIAGSICVNVYAFSPDEQMVSCCSCAVTPNALVSLSAQHDLISNTLTPAVPTSLVIKLLASAPVAGSCVGSAASPGALISGLAAWGTTLHTNTSPTGGVAMTETPFTPATLSAGEFSRLTALCTFINANGSGFGICRSCRIGGLGAVTR